MAKNGLWTNRNKFKQVSMILLQAWPRESNALDCQFLIRFVYLEYLWFVAVLCKHCFYPQEFTLGIFAQLELNAFWVSYSNALSDEVCLLGKVNETWVSSSSERCSVAVKQLCGLIGVRRWKVSRFKQVRSFWAHSFDHWIKQCVIIVFGSLVFQESDDEFGNPSEDDQKMV